MPRFSSPFMVFALATGLSVLLSALTAPACAQADPDLQKTDLQKSLADPATMPELDDAGRAELDGFYAKRGYRPAWNLGDEDAVRKGQAFIDSIDALVTYHGLDRDDYSIDDMRKLAAEKPGDDYAAADKSRLELLISESLLSLAHSLHGDDIDMDALYTGWNYHRQPADIPALVTTALGDGKLEELFDHLSPQNQAYRDLARALQDYRTIASHGGWPKIDLGPSLQPASEPGNNGHNNEPRVAQVRARLAAEGYNAPAPAEGATSFDEGLKKALIAYQTRNGLSPDGHVGAKTQEALSTPVSARILQIRANMERWRHMPEDFPPDRYTLVNIPDFSVTIVEDGKIAYRGIVIDGKPDRQTPFINSKIVNMVVDPPWNVPISIARKDILPRLRKDPHYLERLGIVIEGRESDPTGAEIDWKSVGENGFHYHLRQSPGDLNSLGKLKFNFANPFDVYMHGTPHQELFQKAERDFSSGCVRLEDPIRVGQILLEANKDKGGWSQQRISDEIDAGKTHWVKLVNPMPVSFLYWTVFTTDDGQTEFRKDIYGYDSELMRELKNNPSEKGGNQ